MPGAATGTINLNADLNAQDDDGLGWSTLADARDPSRVVPGAMLLAGNRAAQAVVRIVAVDDDGQIHFVILPGSVEKNRHLVVMAFLRFRWRSSGCSHDVPPMPSWRSSGDPGSRSLE